MQARTSTHCNVPESAGISGRRLPVGAEVLPRGVAHFRVWAPKCQRIEVVMVACEDNPAETCTTLRPEGNGYHSGIVEHVFPPMLYGLRCAGGKRVWPDPASRFQPQGPTGLSQIVDPSGFPWTDAEWKGLHSEGQVIYEMHVGTFTPEGTWAAAIDQLPELRRAGMTVLELMPVADFPGEFGWGYDGVAFFAPTRLYGSPDDFRRFVDRAHAVGLGVILDVVYNHYGPLENSLPAFSDDYTTDRHKNEWGGAINFDGENSGPVREFFRANARYWIDEFHLDGLRFDATQSITDDSDNHILTELVTAAREAAGDRTLFIVAENEPQRVRMLQSPSKGGHGMDAVWNDDFHHAAMVRLTGHNEAYYSDYMGVAEEFLGAIKRGFLYQGQRSQWQKNPRGTSTRGLPATAFVNFLQNHDQIANSGLGDRVDKLSSPGRWRAMTALWLLAPQTPMFFQGQEFSASTPFLYFADSKGEQARRVTRGRLQFLSQFPTLATLEAKSLVAEPADRSTFERCRLNLSERQTHSQSYALHQDLLRLRREDPVFFRQRADLLEGATLGPDCLIVRYFGDISDDDRLLIVNLGNDLRYSPAPQPLLAPPADRVWEILWSTNRVEYGGVGTPPLETDIGWQIAGEAAVVLQPVTRDGQNDSPPQQTS
jgi:maltooligosyltrehalose trehalohydrolase